MQNPSFKLLLVLVVVGPSVVRAAEFRLRERCTVAGGVVRLGDVAQVLADEKTDTKAAEALSRTILLPAPPPGQRRFVRARHIQDLLALRGVNLNEHRFLGASQIAVFGKESTNTRASSAPRPIAVTNSARTKATEIVRRAMLLYLKKQDREAAWKIGLKLTDPQIRQILAARNIQVSGGRAPWTGQQQFAVTCNAGGSTIEINVAATLSRPKGILVASRAIPKGSLIQASDLELKYVAAKTDSQKVLYEKDEVVGLEAVRKLAPGTVLSPTMVRRELLVKRSDIVTVYARSGGVSVRTTGRAKSDGSRGDLILVEAINDRSKNYQARVSGTQEVEVFASAVSAGR